MTQQHIGMMIVGLRSLQSVLGQLEPDEPIACVAGTHEEYLAAKVIGALREGAAMGIDVGAVVGEIAAKLGEV